jgi:DNA-binding XRE family transcriptional regulator
MLPNEAETGNPLARANDPRRLNFGSELRRYRQAAGLSLAELSQRIHYSKGHLSKIENGRVRAGLELARRCDEAVGGGGRLVALAERPAAFGPPAAGGASAEGWWVMGMAPDGVSWAVPVSRRDALAAGASVAGASVAGASVAGASVTGASVWSGLRLAPPRGRGAAALEPALDGFRGMFEQVRRLGQVTGPGFVLPMAIAQTQTVRAMAAAGGPAQGDLLRLAARYAEFVGWMAQEAGNDQVALGWTRTAVEIAGAAGDRDLGAHGWVREALVTLYGEDAAQTVELAVRAQEEPGVSPRIRGLAALREAQGHALAGDHDSCLRALDRGRQLLTGTAMTDTAPGAPAPVSGSALGPTSVPDIGAVVTGWCLHDLGRPAQAMEALSHELSRMPDTARRSRARYGTRLALACLDAGDTDRACSLLDQLLDEIAAVDSATIRLDLRRFARSRAVWRSHPLAGDIEARLPAVLRVRTG